MAKELKRQDLKTTDYAEKGVQGFKKGNPGGGRKLGSLDFKTKFYKMLDKIATQNGITADEVEEQILLVGYKKAKEGDYNFYRDMLDRVHGRATQPTDITTGGEKINVDDKTAQLAAEYEAKLKKLQD